MHGQMIRTAMAFVTVALAAGPDVVQPKDLAAQLQSTGSKPALFHVGYGIMYRSTHIPGSVYAGPGSRAEGLKALKAAASGLPRDREVVVYCGCCPWDECPNVKPAVELLKQMGFKHIRMLMIPSNLSADWIDHGYPVEHGPVAK